MHMATTGYGIGVHGTTNSVGCSMELSDVKKFQLKYVSQRPLKRFAVSPNQERGLGDISMYEGSG